MLNTDRQLLANCAESFYKWVLEYLSTPVQETIGINFTELSQLVERLQQLESQLRTSQGDKTQNDVDESDLQILKNALIHKRRAVANSIESRGKLTFNHDLRNLLDKELEPYSQLINQPWFVQTVAQRMPRLTDYISIKKSEEFLLRKGLLKPPDKLLDEKFQILHAPTLFFSDLAYYRTACDLRGTPVSIAYMDIDNFKKFNSEHGEPKIDRDLLPRFMNTLEAHVYPQGRAYRYGGDEYVVLLPNMHQDEAAEFLYKFQQKLRKIKYFGISINPTVSIGVCEINESSYLTNYELEEKAAEAKQYAKDNGKDKIAVIDATKSASTAFAYCPQK